MGFKQIAKRSESSVASVKLIITTLLITLLCITYSNANEVQVEVNAPSLADYEFARSLTKKVRPAQISKLHGNNSTQEEASFYIFASLSLSEADLKKMMQEAAKYNGVVVIRGLIDNSFPKTVEKISKLKNEVEDKNDNEHESDNDNETDNDDIGLIIDPMLFNKYEIKEVPTYILAKEEECPASTSCVNVFDKLSGNVTPKFALEQFEDKGDLSQLASKLLSLKGA